MLTLREMDESPERRTLMSIIIQAIEDLGSQSEEILEDDSGKKMTDENGEFVKFNIAEDAYRFLTGRNKSLSNICRTCGLNERAIKDTLRRIGPSALRSRLNFFRKILTKDI